MQDQCLNSCEKQQKKIAFGCLKYNIHMRRYIYFINYKERVLELYLLIIVAFVGTTRT